MGIETDFRIDANGDIRHDSGTATYTVLELHRWLQNEADDAAATGDDFIDITYSTPSERATDNIITLLAPFNVDATAAQFLYDGSITQKGGDEIFAGLVVVGSGAVAADLRITQDEAIPTITLQNSGNPDAAAAILARFLVKVRENGADINGRRIIVWARKLGDTYAEFNVTMATGNNVAAIFTATDLNNPTAAATIATWTTAVNVLEGYQLLDIAGDGSANEPYYSKWDQGSQTEKRDLYERTKWTARQGTAETLHGLPGEEFRGITHEFAYDTQTTNFATNDTVAWGTSFAYDGGTGTAPAVGQYWENTTQSGVGKVVFRDGTTTGTVVIQREAATPTWADNDVFTLLGGTGSITQAGAATAPISATLGGSAVVLADNDTGAAGTLWVQMVSGSAPGDNDPLWERGLVASTSNALTNGAATARTVKPEFLGVFTGAAIIGAFGIGIDPNDGVAADVFTTLTNATVSPPNNQKIKVQGLVSGDRVLVTNWDSGVVAPDYNQFTLQTSLLGATETAVVVTAAIPVDTPQTGNLRIQLDTGIYRLVPYTAWATSTFTIASTDFTGANAATQPRNVFLGYIDIATATTFEEVTLKYNANREIFVRVRDGGATPIKTFDTTGTFGTGGLTVTAIRTTDE